MDKTTFHRNTWLMSLWGVKVCLIRIQTDEERAALFMCLALESYTGNSILSLLTADWTGGWGGGLYCCACASLVLFVLRNQLWSADPHWPIRAAGLWHSVNTSPTPCVFSGDCGQTGNSLGGLGYWGGAEGSQLLDPLKDSLPVWCVWMIKTEGGGGSEVTGTMSCILTPCLSSLTSLCF